jgi:pre-mRNA-splicing factor ATP-dependent RNA helicase DHX15/PRP43
LFEEKMKRKLDLGDNSSSSSSSSSSSRKAYSSSAAEGNASVSQWTGRPFSARYYEILKKRQMLPVYEFRDELIEKVSNNQVIIVEGETGSGKVRYIAML